MLKKKDITSLQTLRQVCKMYKKKKKKKMRARTVSRKLYREEIL